MMLERVIAPTGILLALFACYIAVAYNDAREAERERAAYLCDRPGVKYIEVDYTALFDCRRHQPKPPTKG